MTTTAKLRYLRIAPRKVRLVADLIRGKKAAEAQNFLNFTVKGASLPLLNLLKQAIANAQQSLQSAGAIVDPNNLFISKITVDEGPKYKRWRARARGQAAEIQKKTSHITLVLEEVKKTAKKKKPVLAVPTEKPVEEKKAAVDEKPKIRPVIEQTKPKIDKNKPANWRKIFRRKAF